MGRVSGSKLLFCFTEQGVVPESRCCFPGACKSQNDLDKSPVLPAAVGTGTSAGRRLRWRGFCGSETVSRELQRRRPSLPPAPRLTARELSAFLRAKQSELERLL